MQIIKVKKYGLGHFQAKCNAGSIRTTYKSALSYEVNAIEAARALCIKLDWVGFDLAWSSDSKGEYYFVPVAKRNPCNMASVEREFDIIAKGWFDKVNGNSYFSARILDSKSGELVALLPFQYGYGDQYEYEAHRALIDLGLIPKNTPYGDFWIYTKRRTIDHNCKKAEVVAFGKID